MESAKKTINNQNMFKSGEKVAVAVSGGIDSICLLHFLNSVKEEFNIEIWAVNVDHQIRKTSADDSKFVAGFCKELKIPFYKFKVDVPKLASKKKLGLEEAARVARYKVFESLVQKGLANKIAIAHHQSDQVETVLLNIFRGSGLNGASGMDAVQGVYVRPFLNTSKIEILQYANENNLPHVEDETNLNTDYSRNFLRNVILPELRSKWKNVDSNILNFAKICKIDNDYINQSINFDDIFFENKTARIPLYKFVSPDSVQNRILMYAFKNLGLSKDIEKRHLNILKDLALHGENGSKINLPNKIKASLDYDELVLYVPKPKMQFMSKDFKLGKTNFENLTIKIKKTSKWDLKQKNCHFLDADKLPKDAKWRSRQNGDVFKKFAGGEKKLKDYMIDIKIPNSVRDGIPLLANDDEVYCVLGYEISDNVKVTDVTKKVYVIEYKFNK
ncbi:MAG TPA: tRNA lysidine(34) synthetase TilS [Clostridiales bacterium]|nr:tRNA lysidine(34) synthetase TilS [Clostridiales bacterium]